MLQAEQEETDYPLRETETTGVLDDDGNGIFDKFNTTMKI